MRLLVWILLAPRWLARVPAATGAQALSPRIYVHQLPTCAFGNFDAEFIDALVYPNPPILPLHRRIVDSKYVTYDPAAADLFYIPAPFHLWMYGGPGAASPKKDDLVLHADPERQLLNGNEVTAVDAASVSGNGARSILLWVRVSPEEAHGRMTLVSTGGDTACYGVALFEGCPAVVGCGCGDPVEHVPVCGQGQGVGDGRWHHIAATFDGAISQVILDGVSLGSAALGSLDTRPGGLRYGGVGSGCETRSFRGEIEGVRLFGSALDASRVPWEHGGFRTTSAPCVREVREYVESSPWFQRSEGWDHFVLLGSVDYPVQFTANLPNAEEHYVLERAWPAFGHMAVLHLGARAEICAGFLSGLGGEVEPDGHEACWRRYFRMVTVPPILDGERFDCREIARLPESRPVRVAYHGLAYSSMVERSAVLFASKSPITTGLMRTGQVRLDFTNWSFESLHKGQCNMHQAFAGLCPWRAVGRGYDTAFGMHRKVNMRKRSLELWPQSDFCLVMPGDGGYELRMYSIINSGCIPVIIYSSQTSLPKLSFADSVEWKEFAIFWDLNHAQMDPNQDFYGVQSHVRAALQLLSQLLAVSPKTARRKRQALLRYAASFSWDPLPGCGRQAPSALDLAVSELLHRARMPAAARQGQVRSLRPEDWRRKVPRRHFDATAREDVNGNRCPLGFPSCDRSEGRGDVCHSLVPGCGYACPVGCHMTPGVLCAAGPNKTQSARPCRVRRCEHPVLLQPDTDPSGGAPRDKRLLRIALISFSTRPELRELTWPSLRRFVELHPGRYELELHTEPLLDVRDFSPAWNKFAFVRRAFDMGDYHAVVWIDDDILITEPWRDPLFDHLVSDLLPYEEKLVLASLDEKVSQRVPFNTGLLIFKRGWDTRRLLKKLFRIGSGRKTYMLGGKTWLQPGQFGFWDQDAAAVYVEEHGMSAFAVVEHRTIQSFVRQTGAKRHWEKGDFAAHFTGIRNHDLLLHTVREFIDEQSSSAECNATSSVDDGRERLGHI